MNRPPATRTASSVPGGAWDGCAHDVPAHARGVLAVGELHNGVAPVQGLLRRQCPYLGFEMGELVRRPDDGGADGRVDRPLEPRDVVQPLG